MKRSIQALALGLCVAALSGCGGATHTVEDPESDPALTGLVDHPRFPW